MYRRSAIVSKCLQQEREKCDEGARVVMLHNILDSSNGCTVDNCTKKEEGVVYHTTQHDLEYHTTTFDIYVLGVTVTFKRDTYDDKVFHCVCGEEFRYRSDLLEHIEFVQKKRGLNCETMDQYITEFILENEQRGIKHKDYDVYGLTMKANSERIPFILESSENLTKAMECMLRLGDTLVGYMVNAMEAEKVKEEVIVYTERQFLDIFRRVEGMQQTVGTLNRVARVELLMRTLKDKGE